MNRSLLERPFERNEIKQRKGNSGKMLDYVEAHSIIQRLNDAFDAEWSFTILKHDILKETDEVVVLGELKAGNVVKTQFGSSQITRAKDTGETISLASDFKAAATDALKKTATMFGVALSLYRNGNGSNQQNDNRNRQKIPSPAPSNTEPQPPDNGNSQTQRGGNGNMPEAKIGKVEISFQPVETSSAAVYRPQFKAYETNATADAPAQDNGNGNGRKQMSVKQFSYIKSYGRKLGYDLNALSQKSIEIFNRELPYLTVSEASTFIDHMQAGLFRSNNTAV
jgi:hypothetical protein